MAAFKASAKKLGVKVQDLYRTLGDHDAVNILGAPDDETATAAWLPPGTTSRTSSEAMRMKTFASLQASLLVVACLVVGESRVVSGAEPIRLLQTTPRNRPENLPDNVSLGPVIPGLAQGAIPQGLAYIPTKDWIVISYHFDGKRPAMLAVVDLETGDVKQSLTLLEKDGNPHMGHGGGLVISRENLWIATGGPSPIQPTFGVVQQLGPKLWYFAHAVYRVPLRALAEAAPVSTLRLQPWFLSESRGGAMAINGDTLWVAEYVRKADDRQSQHRVMDRDGNPQCAWACGYKLNDDEDLITSRAPLTARVAPDVVMVVPKELQGMTFLKGHIVLSLATGVNSPSHLAIYRDPIAESASPHTTVTSSTGANLPAWFLDSRQQVRSFNIVPMAQGVVARHDGLVLITESGSPKFKCKSPLEYVVLIEPKQ